MCLFVLRALYGCTMTTIICNSIETGQNSIETGQRPVDRLLYFSRFC